MRRAPRLLLELIILCSALLLPSRGEARIEIFLMNQTVGLKPPPLEGGIRFRGTPFGHMALYVESATRDDEGIIRQCREGERGGLVLTVDRQLKDRFFIATTRDEFFYGGMDPDAAHGVVTRTDIRRDLASFNDRYGHLYKTGLNMSGLGQDYGVLYIRSVWGLVYPTTREEEAKIIDFWRQHYNDEFARIGTNCVTTLFRSLNYAGLDRRSFFVRGLAPYNAWNYLAKKFVFADADSRAPDGTYLRRQGTYITRYGQIDSDAVFPSGRPFNLYSLQNMEYTTWASPRASHRLPSWAPVTFAHYPTGRERVSDEGMPYSMRRFLWWIFSQPDEFVRLWFQSFKGLWFTITG